MGRVNQEFFMFQSSLTTAVIMNSVMQQFFYFDPLCLAAFGLTCFKTDLDLLLEKQVPLQCNFLMQN